MDVTGKLEELLKGTDFKTAPESGGNHPLTEMGRHNLVVLERLEDERKDRIMSLIWTLMADKMQPMAIQKNGHTGQVAVKSVLKELFSEVNPDCDLHDLSKQFHEELTFHGLTYLQAEKLWQAFTAGFPSLLANYIAEGVDRWRLLPRVAASEAVDILVRMMNEVAYDYN